MNIFELSSILQKATLQKKFVHSKSDELSNTINEAVQNIILRNILAISSKQQETACGGSHFMLDSRFRLPRLAAGTAGGNDTLG